MSGELEAAGAAATAGLAAGAIEGKAGARGAGEGACLNCGVDLAGAYCAACGQPAHISRTLGDVLGDFLHAFLHFDTKAWRTLPRLMARPGTLTYDYIHGHRARYVSPLAMFLFTIFLMFFVFSMVGGPDFLRANLGDEAQSERVPSVPEAEAALADARARRDAARAALADVEAEAAKVRNDGQPGAGGRATGLIAGPRANARVAEAAVVRAETRLERATARAAGADRNLVGVEAKDGTVVAGDDEDGRAWQDQLREAVQSGEIKVNSGSARLDQKVRAALLNPDLALYKLQETTSKFSFLLVPISLPFIALLFLWKRGVTFFDHVVFSLYSLSFMSLLFVALALFARAGEWTAPFVGAMAGLVPPVHMFFHLGGTYKLGWWSALWRTSFLLFFLMFIIVIFALSILALGLLA